MSPIIADICTMQVAEKYGRTVEEMINHVEDDDSLTEALSSGIHTQKLLRFKRLRLLGQLREDLRNRLHRSMTIRGPWEVCLILCFVSVCSWQMRVIYFPIFLIFSEETNVERRGTEISIMKNDDFE